jgi:hypothetical protein
MWGHPEAKGWVWFYEYRGTREEKHPDYKENLSLMLKEVAEEGNQLKITSCF